MRARSLDQQATRSGAFARRAGIVTLAAALVAVPLAAAVPANAAPDFPITSVAFDNTALMYGGESKASFNGDPALTRIDDQYICQYQYKNGEPSEYSPTTPSYGVDAPVQRYEYLTSERYTEGDVYTVAYGEPVGTVENDDLACVVPPLSTPGLPQASLTLTATPEVPPVPLTATDLKFTRGVAVDQYLSYTTVGLDFTATGGYMGFGPQSGDEPAPGYINPLEGITIDTLDEATPGKAPRVHFTGTPKYSGTVDTGFFVTDGTNTGVADVKIITTDKTGAATPITIDLAIGQPVAGATVAIVAAGLQEGAAWSATVRSTPIIVGSGTIAFGGQLAARVTIPAGLEAGSHSITVLSTNADGTPFTSVLYFTVSATGTLLAVSTSAAELAATGTDFAPSLFIAGGLLLAGAAFAGVTVIRRRRNA